MADLLRRLGVQRGNPSRAAGARFGSLRSQRRRSLQLLLLLTVPALVGMSGLADASSAQAVQTHTAIATAQLNVAGVASVAGVAGVAGVVTAPNLAPRPAATTPPGAPGAGSGTSGSTSAGNVSVNLGPGVGKPSQTISIILLLTVLSVAPALLMLCTAFTKIIVVLSLTRNALGTPTIPPNQVLAGLALFLSLFVMAPVLSQMNDQALQPYLKGTITQSQAFTKGVAPLRTFMLKETRKGELTTMIALSKGARPAKAEDVPLTTLIPAFVLSELKSAFIIGFVVFIPFLVIDLVVSSSLMSMGMMMLPPVMISLPFKLLLFVMVDGWDLIAKALVSSYH